MGRVLVVGLDGATWKLLRPWVEAGELPSLGKLCQKGTQATLKSSVPPISPCSWTSFATGKNPGKHGLVDFVFPRAGTYELEVASQVARRAPALWSILSGQGKRVGLVGVPLTYPPEAVNGFMISCFLAPGPQSNYTYPPELKQELEERLGGFQLAPDERYRSSQQVDKFLADMRASVRKRLEAALYLMEEKPWDLFVVVFWSPDMVQHETWHLLDTTHPRHDPDEAARHRSAILDYWRELDGAVGRLLERAGNDTLSIVLSDHGFGPVHSFFLLNTWLKEAGYLAIKHTPVAQAKELLFRLGITPLNTFRWAKLLGLARLRRRVRFQQMPSLMKRLFLSFRDVDWSRTRAFAAGSFGQVYINTKGIWPQGVVALGQEYEALREEIAQAAMALRDPQSGLPIIERVLRREEVYSGPYLSSMPDLLLEARGFEYMCFGHVDFGANRVVVPAMGLSGHHCPEGMLVMQGPGVKEGAMLEDASIMDLAPTILYVLGEPISLDMDGRLLEEAFTPDFLTQRRATFDLAPLEGAPPGEATQEIDDAEIRKRLRGWGYVG